MSEKILAALRQLDPANDNHWTAEGQPRIDTVKLLAGDQTITRDAITQALPGFVRARAAEMLPAGGASTAQAPAAPAQAPTPTPTPSAPGSEAASAAQSATQEPGDGNGSEQEGTDRPVADSGARAAQEAAESIGDPKARLAALQEHHADAVEYHARATRILQEAQAALDREIEAQSATGNGSALPDALSGYFARQQELREQRAARIEAMRGVKLSEILPTKAKIDEAFARRTGRGNKRPTQL